MSCHFMWMLNAPGAALLTSTCRLSFSPVPPLPPSLPPSLNRSPQRDHVKDLSRLGRDLRRTVIVDNNPFSFLLQPENGVPCVPFFGHQADDMQVSRQHSVLSIVADLATLKADCSHCSAASIKLPNQAINKR